MAIGLSWLSGTLGSSIGSILTSIIDQTKPDLYSIFQDSIVSGGINVISGLGAGIGEAVFQAGYEAVYKVLTTIVAMSSEAICDVASYLYEKLYDLFAD